MSAELPPVLAQRFQIGDVLASGRAGTTYRATELATQRVGALKVITAARSWTAAERGRLGRELEKLASLKHPYLAETWATGIADDAPWVFRAEIVGESLRAKIDAARTAGQPVAEALLHTAQIAAALDEVHRAGLLQRDLSPEHVIVRPDSTIGLIDTGVATRIASASVFEIVGKPAYVSPEHAAGKLVSFRSDLYALGCMLFEMLTGAPPFDGAPDALLEAHRSKPAPALEGQPAPVTALVAQLLQKDPRDRPFSAQQVRRTLEPLTGPIGGGTAKPAPKGTLMGLAAVGAAPGAPAPRADATEQLSALDLAKHALGPPPTPASRPAPRPDGTEQLSALDLARAETLLGTRPLDGRPAEASSPSQPMQRQSVPPPVPPQAKRASVPPPPPGRPSSASGQIPAAPPSGQVPAPPSGQIAATSSAELDYDDFAETKAVSRDMVNELRALGGLEQIDPALAQGQPAGAAPPAPQAPQGFGAQPQGFGAQPQGFGTPQAQQGFGAPQTQPQGFGAPQAQQGFGVQPQGFGAPQQTQQGFGAPSSPGGFGAPSSPGGFPAQGGFQGAQQGFGGPSAAPAYSAPAPEPKKSRAGLWIALGLIGFCGFSTVAGAAAGWFLDVGGMQTQILAATSGAPTIPAPAIVPVAPPPTTATAPIGPVAPIAPTAPTTPTAPTAPAVMYRATVASNPPGAAITVNGMPRGPAPVTVEVPRDSMVQASATLDGYYDSSMSMQAVSDLSMTITLQPRATTAVAATTPVIAPTTPVTSPSSSGSSSGSSSSGSSARPSSSGSGSSGSSSGSTSSGSSSGATSTGSGTGLASGMRPASSGTTSGTTTGGSSGTTSSGSGGGLAARIAPTTSTGGTTTGTTSGTTTGGTSGTGAPRLASGLRPSSGGTSTGATTAPASGGTTGAATAPAAGGGSVDDLRAQARAHFQARRFREAAETYERATRMAPTNVNLWSGLGAARLAAGDNAGAAQAYERAVQLAPTTAAYHAALGRAYLQSGNRDGARREFQRALDLDPQNRDAQTGLSRL